MEQFTRVPNRVLLAPDLSVNAKLVYAVLASHVSNGGTTCWPGRATIAREANLSTSSVKRAIKELRAADVLTWTTRARQGSLESDSNLYSLPLQGDLAGGVTENPPRFTGDRPVGSQGTDGRVTGTQELDLMNQTKVNQTKEPTSVAFERFWSAYPRKVGKAKARTAFATACKRANPEAVIDGAHALAADPNLPEQQFIPHPTTWLARDGWDDEPLPQRRGPGPVRRTTDDKVRDGLDLARRLAGEPQTLQIGA